MANNDREIRRIYVAGASARMVAGFARAAGFQVITADLFADRDTQMVAQTHRIGRLADCAEIGDQIQFDAWIMAGGMENFPNAIRKLCSRAPLLGPVPDSIAQCRNPANLKQLFTSDDLQVRFPKTCFSFDELRSEDIESGEWLLKKTNRSGGHAIRVATANDLTKDHTNELYEDTIAQEFVNGRALSGAFIANDAQCQMLQICSALGPEPDRQSGNRRFQYCGSVGPVDISPHTLETIRETGRAAASRFNLRGIFGIDVIESGSNVYALEVNPRIPASLEISRLPGAELFTAHVDACLNPDKPLKENWSDAKDGVGGKAILYNGANAIEIDQRMSDQLLSMALPPYDANGFRIADVPRAGQAIASGHPIVTILADTPSANQSEAALHNAMAEINTFMHSH